MSERGPLKAREILDTLFGGGVDFLVIGGFAVIAHGYSRLTDDIDIVPAPDRDNLVRLETALNDLDYRVFGTEEFEPDEVVKPDLEALLAGGSWVLATKYGGLDILQFVEPDLDYATLADAAVVDRVYGHEVKFCGYEHLIAMKKAAGRPQDLADIAQLAALRDSDS